MIIRLTELTIDNKHLAFSPFVVEIPDMEVGWDHGRDYMESLIAEKDAFPDDVIDQIPDHYEEFTFDYDFEYTINCAI